MPIFSGGLNGWGQQRLNRESLRAESIVADLREFEIPDPVDLLVASYIIQLPPEPYAQVKTWQAKVGNGGMCSISTHGRFPHEPDELWLPADFELKRLFEEAGWFLFQTREETTGTPQWRDKCGNGP